MDKHTRRDFLRLAGLSTATVIVAACAGEPEVVEKIVKETVEVVKEVEKQVTVVVEKVVVIEPTAEPTAVPSKYKESPMMADMVAAGDLPPVDERLPEDVRVCDVLDRIGEYGGTLTVGQVDTKVVTEDALYSMDFPMQLCPSRDLKTPMPHLLKGFEVSDNLMEFTCHMRKGLKWSDGTPLTTQDVKFWWDDVLLNTEITPLPALQFRPAGELMQLTIVDDYTYKFTFNVAYPGFPLAVMSHRQGFGHNHYVPSEYLKQFHIKYNEKANDLAKSKGFDFWYQLLGREMDRQQGMDRPRLEDFLPVRDTPQMIFFERNPYYHAVDPEGNQLPYMDKIVSQRVADLATFDAKVVGGTYDLAAYPLRILFYATYAEGAAATKAHIALWPSGMGSSCLYGFNMSYADEEWRKVFADDRFRQALSLAINRPDINNVVYFGNATDTQFTVITDCRHFKPEYGAAYAEHDPDKANALLDEIGLAWNAAHTHRTWPVSKADIIIPWDLVEQETPKGPITELVTEYWKAVGIDIQWKSVTRNLMSQKMQANEEPISCWHGDETTDILFLRRPKYFAPIAGDESAWSQLWGQWYTTKGEKGEEPPQMIKDLYTWMEDYLRTDGLEPAAKVLQSQAEHVWHIGTVGNTPHPFFLRNTLGNISETGGYYTWDTLRTFTEHPEQWFISQG
jgi:peptide/nickel transport system substrate-binding protein